MIGNITKSFRNIFAKGHYNVTKILSLTIGLALGLVLFAKAWFETSFDTFYADSDRMYQVMESFSGPEDNGNYTTFANSSGGWAKALKEYFPQIETATRYTWVYSGDYKMLDNLDRFSTSIYVADTSFFDIFSLPILSGDPKDVLDTEDMLMISKSLAKKFGGDPVGRSLSFVGHEQYKFTVGGVYEDFPANSSIRIDILLSLKSIERFTSDGSTQMLGNDRYSTYLKLKPRTSIEDIDESIGDWCEKYLPMEEIRKSYGDICPKFMPISEKHAIDTNYETQVLLMCILAAALLLIAILNYILINVSTIIGKAREMAVRKCYGATMQDISRDTVTDAAVHTILALVLALLLQWAGSDLVEKLLGESLENLLTGGGLWIMAGVCIATILVTGFLPALMYMRIPVAAVMRSYKESRRKWKMTLLSVQFGAASLICVLLMTIAAQYRIATYDKPGYEYEDLAAVVINSITDYDVKTNILEEIRKIPEVKCATFGPSLIDRQSGDNVSLPGSDTDLFNIADLYWTDEYFIDTYGLKIIEGSNFTSRSRGECEMLVSRSFAEKLKTVTDWDDVIGKTICVTTHNPNGLVIKGIYEDFRIGPLTAVEYRASCITYYPKMITSLLLVRFHKISPEAIAKVNELLEKMAPNDELKCMSYADNMRAMYSETLNLRNSIAAGGFGAIFVVILGLIGYTVNEVSRRRKEIAVRKVNGAVFGDVLRLISSDIAMLAVPSVIVGAVAGAWISDIYQRQFAVKAGAPWYCLVAGCLAVLAVTLLVTAIAVRRSAAENPAKVLKSE